MSQPIASSPLGDPDDEQNQVQLFTSFLEVVRKGKTKKYALTPIMKLEINHRQLLGPLIGGGLLSCMAFITLFSWSKWAVFLLVLGIGGMALMYYGLVGVHVLTLKEDKIHYDIQLAKVAESLNAFIKFYNQLIPRMAQGSEAAFPVFLLPSIKSKDGGYLLYLTLPDALANSQHYMIVDFMKLNQQFHFSYDKMGHYHAEVAGEIPDEAIIMRNRN